MNNIRKRNWCCIVYPESLVGDKFVEKSTICSYLESLAIPAFLSPLHHGDREESKKHYHLMLMFDGVKTYNQVLDLLLPLNTTVPFAVESKKGYARYLCHLDNPDKEQFDIRDVISFSGANYQKVIEQDDLYLDDIIKLIHVNRITQPWRLYQCCKKYNEDLIPVMRKNWYFLRDYLRSLYFSDNIESGGNYEK